MNNGSDVHLPRDFAPSNLRRTYCDGVSPRSVKVRMVVSRVKEGKERREDVMTGETKKERRFLRWIRGGNNNE